MTVDEAIATIYHVLDLSFDQRDTIAKLLQQQQQQIEQLKCCGNCENYQPEFEGCGKQQVIVCRNESCDEWEAMK